MSLASVVDMSIDSLGRTMEACNLISLLKHWKLPTSNENRLQAALEQVLIELEIPFEREKRLEAGVIDFCVDGLGVECKVKGSYPSVMEQVARYCGSQAIDSILVVTTVAAHRKLDGMQFQGKVVRVYWLNVWQ
jgi:hypothetical protein